MQRAATSPADYIAALPEDRRDDVAADLDLGLVAEAVARCDANEFIALYEESRTR